MAIDLKSLSQPHNNLMLAILDSPSRAASLLRASLEPWIVERMTDEPPVALAGTFIDEELRASRSDRLFEVRFKGGGTGFVYVLLEHKSTSDPGTAMQVARYKGRIWEQYAQGRARRLWAMPTVIPLVVYHGRKPWTAPRSLADMLADKDERVRALEPSFGYFLRDLGSIEIPQLAEDPATRAGLVALRYSHAGAEQEGERRAALDGIMEWLPERTDYLDQLLVYILVVWKVPVPELEAAAERAKPGRGEQIVGPIVQELIDQGRVEGRVEGKVEGRAQGKVEGMAQGMANALMKLLEHRFGPLAGTVRRQIEEASPVQLDVWFAAALSGQSLSEVLESPA